MSFSSRRKFIKLVGLTSGLVMSSRSWISMAQEGAKASGAIVDGPFLFNPSDTSITISWRTENPGLSWVEYWPVNHPEQRKIVQDAVHGIRRYKARIHRVTLSELQPDTKYAYKVFSRPKAPKSDVIVMSNDKEDAVFKTLNSKGKTCTAFIANDTHEHGEVLGALMGVGKAAEKDLIFHNGDLLSHIAHDDHPYHDALNGFQSHIAQAPFIYIRGNHEYRGVQPEYMEEVIPPRDGRYYYAFRQGPVMFIVLDTCDDHPDDHDDEVGQTDWEVYFDKQAEWLRKFVKSPEYLEAPYRVVIGHIPIMGIDPKNQGPRRMPKPGEPERPPREEFITMKKLRTQIAPLLGDATIIINAHTHRNAFIDANDEVPAPVLINDNKGYVTLDANEQRLEVEQFSKTGEPLLEKTYKPDVKSFKTK